MLNYFNGFGLLQEVKQMSVFTSRQTVQCSPVLFNVYTVGITSNQLEGPGRTLSFADDVLAYRQGKSRQDIASGLQDELDRMHHWCEEYNGKLHPDKASVLWCTLNNRAVKDDMPEVSIAGKVI